MKCTRPVPLYFNEQGERISRQTYDRALFDPLHASKVFRKDVGCGKCLACRINKRREWTLRLCHEEIFSETAYFVTLTYDEDHLPRDDNDNPCVLKRDVQLFMKRLRRVCSGHDLRFFLNSEYGSLGRPHYHMLLFNAPESFMFEGSLLIRRGKSVGFTSPNLKKVWGNGSVEFGIASKERAGYCAKYFIDRKEIDEILVPNFSLMSLKPGIGFAYQEKIHDKVKAYGLFGCLNSCGTYVSLPRYYRSKIFSDEERHAQLLASFAEPSDQAYEEVLRNADIVEENRKRALTWKGKKQKLA